MVKDCRIFISRADVERAYRSILGRNPESVDAVYFWGERARGLSHLVSGFLSSEEFSRMTPEQQARGRFAADIWLTAGRNAR